MGTRNRKRPSKTTKAKVSKAIIVAEPSCKKSRKRRTRKPKRASKKLTTATLERQMNGKSNAKDFSVYKLIWKIILQKKSSLEFVYSLIREDSPLHHALLNIRSAYTGKQLKSDLSTAVDYGQLDFRLAYIYAYFTSHVNFVRKMWHQFWPQAEKHFPQRKKKSLKVCSIGGGPGSDILGLNLFLQDEGLNPSITAAIFDKWPQWHETSLEIMEAVRNKTGQPVPTISHAEFDFFEQYGKTQTDRIGNADVVTMVKFLSVVCQDENVCSTKLTQILDAMKMNALLFFVENSGGNCDEILSSAALKAGFQLLAESPRQIVSLSKPEKKEMDLLKLMGNKKQFHPRRSCRLVGSLWVKAATAA